MIELSAFFQCAVCSEMSWWLVGVEHHAHPGSKELANGLPLSSLKSLKTALGSVMVHPSSRRPCMHDAGMREHLKKKLSVQRVLVQWYALKTMNTNSLCVYVIV